MSWRKTISLMGLVLLFLAVLPIAAAQPYADKIEPQLLDQFNTEGTVDYVVITTPHRVRRLQDKITAKFARAMNPQHGRSGVKPVTAYLSLSFGVVTDQDGPFGDIRSLSVAISRSRADETL